MPEQTEVLTLPDPLVDCGYFNHDKTSGFGDTFYDDIGFAGLFGTYSFASFGQRYGGWLRYVLPLQAGDIVTEAYLLYTVHRKIKEGTQPWTVQLNLLANKVLDSNNPANHAEALSFSSTGATTAQVEFDVPELGIASEVQTVDITDVIQEIIDQASWAEDNHILILWRTLHPTTEELSGGGQQVIDIIDPFSIDTASGEELNDYPWIFVEDYYPKLVVKYLPFVPGSGYDKQVIHDLEISHDITYTHFLKEVEHTLVIEQDIEVVVELKRTVEHTLTVTQDIDFVENVEVTLDSLLFIFQEIAVSHVRTFELEHELNIQQQFVGNTKFMKFVYHDLVVENDDVSAIYSYTRNVESVLDITHYNTKTPGAYGVVHTLSIEQDIELISILHNPELLEQVLTFEQDIVANAVRTRAIEHELTIQHSVLGYFQFIGASGGVGPGGEGGVSGGGATWQGGGTRPDVIYKPFADTSVNFPVEPTLTPQDMVIDYPPTSPTLSITLPKPLFNNREELLIPRIQRYTRGGNIKTYSDPSWGKVRTFRYKFEGFSNTEIETFFTFLSNTLGLQVRLTDYEGRQWDGFIINPGGESGQFFRLCGRTTEFDFQGVEV